MSCNTIFLDCKSKITDWEKQFPTPLKARALYIWIVFSWQIVSTAGWLDALISYISSKRDAKTCILMVKDVEEERHLEAYYEGLRQVAVALGNISTLETLVLLRFWNNNKHKNTFGHCRCCYRCQAFSVDLNFTKLFTRIDFRLEALVLNQVHQITEFHSWPVRIPKPCVFHHIEEYMEALQKHSSLKSLSFCLEQEFIHNGLLSIPSILLSMPNLTKVCFNFGSYFFKAKTVENFAVEDFVQQLATLAQALANHPQIQELQLQMPFHFRPKVSLVWQELLCNGIACMKSIRRLTLNNVPSWTASMVQALRRLVPSLSELIVSGINTPEEYLEVSRCVIYGRHLTTLNISMFRANIYFGLFEEDVKLMRELMEGVWAMNKTGREYVLDDATNKCKALVVLESVKDNLSCLYIHLRESSLFCNVVLQ